MADNYLENRYNDCLKLKEKREAERKKRLRQYLEAYKRRLKEERARNENNEPQRD